MTQYHPFSSTLSRIFTLAAVFLVLFLTQSIRPEAAAAAADWESTFAIDVHFVDDNAVGVLSVHVTDPSGIVTSQSFPITCNPSSGNIISDGVANFKGNTGEYVRCNVPSIRQLVRKMTGGQFTPAASCDCKEAVFAEFNVNFNNQPDPAGHPNPLFHLPDIELAAPISPFDYRPALNFTVNEHTSSSQGFPGQMSWLHSEVAPIGVNLFEPFFAVSAPLYHPAPITGDVHADLTVTLNAQTLYIGYNPETGESFNGQIIDLHIDPGCPGHRGGLGV
ncbi:MAG: hypothetical protein QNJ45_24295 [Ardenticatenaceae bacterium]|nr:hypothetical protein [Ardenticatenaceae bacterium]